MTRQHLEHIIRASAGNANVRDVVIISSRAILGAYPNAPEELTRSMEADVFPKDAPERSILPLGWRDRLVKVDTPGTLGAVG